VNSRLLAGLLAALVGSGCSDDGPSAASGPVETAEAYVEAIGERDGERWCDLVAPYISGTLELELENPDSSIRGVESCGELVGGFIGYVGENVETEFVGATVQGAELGEREGRLQAVELDLELETKVPEYLDPEGDQPASTEPLRDVVCLAEFDGEWRVAKLSAVAQAASLGFTIGDETAEADPLAPPDLEAQLRTYAAEQAEFENRAEAREASYGEAGELARCEGLTIDDPAGDSNEYVHPAPDEPPPPTPQADLRSVTLNAQDGGYCLRFTADGPIEGPATYSFNLRDSASGQSFIQIFDVDLREDGLVRVTSGEDEDDHPIAVPAEVGISGNEVTLVITPETFEAGEPTPSTTGSRPTDSFAFMASATATLSERRALNDDLGQSGPSYSYAYPSGDRCDFAEPGSPGQPAGC